MNGSQEIRQPYSGAAPPPAREEAQFDPGLGAVPPTWRKNVYGYGDDPRRKSPMLASILSLMPGLGQVYVGYYQQGFTNIIVAAGLIVLIANAHHGTVLDAVLPLLGLFLAFFWLYNVVDAFRRATFYNQALAGLSGVEIPEDMKLPKSQGSLVGGVVLIVFGVVLFANTALGMSLEWLNQWWPMALVLAGVYLLFASLRARRAAARAD